MRLTCECSVGGGVRTQPGPRGCVLLMYVSAIFTSSHRTRKVYWFPIKSHTPVPILLLHGSSWMGHVRSHMPTESRGRPDYAAALPTPVGPECTACLTLYFVVGGEWSVSVGSKKRKPLSELCMACMYVCRWSATPGRLGTWISNVNVISLGIHTYACGASVFSENASRVSWHRFECEWQG